MFFSSTEDPTATTMHWHEPYIAGGKEYLINIVLRYLKSPFSQIYFLILKCSLKFIRFRRSYAIKYKGSFSPRDAVHSATVPWRGVCPSVAFIFKRLTLL